MNIRQSLSLFILPAAASLTLLTGCTTEVAVHPLPSRVTVIREEEPPVVVYRNVPPPPPVIIERRPPPPTYAVVWVRGQ